MRELVSQCTLTLRCFCSLVTPVENIVPTDPRYEASVDHSNY